MVRHKFYIEVINSPSSRSAAGVTNSPSSRDAAEETNSPSSRGVAGVTNSPSSRGAAGVTNSPSKIRGGRGALITPTTPTTPTTHVFNTRDMKALRRQLRSNGTPAEGRLWNILKGKKVGGLQFRRQYSVGQYILDFYCPALKLAIELDGNYHYNTANSEHDMDRDEDLLNDYGIQTLRFENKIVFEQPQTIVDSVLRILTEKRGETGSTPPNPL